MSQKTLAYPEREVALVLAAIKSPAVYDTAVAAGLLAEHVTQPPVAAIWAVVVECYEAGGEVRGAVMVERLRQLGKHDACKDYLRRVKDIPVMDEVQAHDDAARIVSAARAREADVSLASALVELRTSNDPASALAVLRDRAFGVAVDQERAKAKRSIHGALEDVLKKMVDPVARTRRIVGVATFIDTLDEKTRGYQFGKVVVIGARPGAGKTAFVTSTLAAMCERHDPSTAPMPPCLFVSLEMDDDELVARLICAMARVEYEAMMFGALPHYDVIRAINTAADRINRAPLEIDDETPRTVEQIAAEIYRWTRRKFRKGQRGGVVYIDYLTRIKRSPGIKTLQDHVMHCMQVLTDVAKRTGHALVILAQMTRGHVKEGRMPEMDDLKGGGDIEENAFHVILLHPLGKAEDAAASRVWRGSVAALIEKNRSGPSNVMVMLKFDGAMYRFRAWNYEIDGSLDDVLGSISTARGGTAKPKYKPTQKTLPLPPARASGPGDD